MRLKVALILTIMLGITAIASAQGVPLDDLTHMNLVVTQPKAWFQSEDGTSKRVQLEQIDPAVIPTGPTAGSGGEECSDNLPVLGIDDTGATLVPNTFLLYDPTDPVLSCRWQSPYRGFRTVWYRLVADRSTLLVVDTSGSTYDTILGVYEAGDPINACTTLIEVACNDDFNRFTSRITTPVRAGETYYIQVGDYHAAYQGDPNGGDNKLFVTAISTPLKSNWEVITSDPASPVAQRSRHVAIAVENKVYVIAGQVGAGTTLINTPNAVVYDTANSDPGTSWQTLQAMPAGGGYGYSYTTAAYINGKIYIPSGFIGVDGSYDGQHYAYDIAQNRWPTPLPSSNNWADLLPSILATAIAHPWLSFDGYFLIGGLTGLIPGPSTPGFEARREMYFYASASDLWFQVPAELNRGRFGHVAATQIVDGADQICVAGGFGKDTSSGLRELLSSTECFHIDNGNWSTLGTAELNYLRVYADSSVNADGDWYIYGGYDGNDRAVPAVEWFNRETKEWQVLDIRFDLGGINLHDPNQDARPPRLFPRGGFVENNLWVFGGETVTQGIVNLIERVELRNSYGVIPPPALYFPIFLNNASDGSDKADTFTTARRLNLNESQSHRFLGESDFVDVYYFDVPSFRPIAIKVSQLPANSDYALQLFTEQKGANPPDQVNIGATQMVMNRTLEAKRYYVILQRNFPPPAIDPSPPPYTIEVQG